MPELTVSMPARNREKLVGKAIASVLQQQGVDLELIVVDDGSEDNTVIESFNDPRIQLIRYETCRGFAACHNEAIRRSRSAYIAVIDYENMLLPGALRKMLGRIKSDPSIGQLHCNFYNVDEDGKTTREGFRKQRQTHLSHRSPDTHHRRDLLVNGMVSNHLLFYRKAVFESIGMFNEELKYGADYEMAIRIADRFRIVAMPEFLYAHHHYSHDKSRTMGFPGIRLFLHNLQIVRRLRKSGQIHYLKEKQYKSGALMLAGLLSASGLKEKYFALRKWRSEQRSIWDIAWTHVRPIGERIYSLAVRHGSWWQLDWMGNRQAKNPRDRKRIAYYLWKFPILSETFIRREIAALTDRGYKVQVYADEPADLEFADEEMRRSAEKTIYLKSINWNRLREYRNKFLRKRPLTFINLMLYTVLHKYDSLKTFEEDRWVFRRALYLAGMMMENEIDHVHAPWANRNAFIALMASSLSGISFSVEARAHDLHRKGMDYALREVFEGARFGIVNCEYNNKYLRSLVKDPLKLNLHTIYEGVDPHSFNHVPGKRSAEDNLRILCVARLDQQKGLEHLLRACRMLKDTGYTFACEIIGGNAIPPHADYVVQLKKLHRSLRLEETVFFKGSCSYDTVMKSLEQSDIFILPCVRAEDGSMDITPNAVIEAMAMGLPVVSTHLSAIPEIVEDGVSGLLVPPGDVNALNNSMVRLFEDAGLREQLGEKARARVEERFNLAKNIIHFTKLLEGEG